MYIKDGTVLTEEQRQALEALAECFADDGIVVDAENIRAALACIRSVESRAAAADADIARLHIHLTEARRRVEAYEAVDAAGGWQKRAEAADDEIARLTRERNEARGVAQGLLASLREKNEAADAAKASASALARRVEVLEDALDRAADAMRACAQLLVPHAADTLTDDAPAANGHSEEAPDEEPMAAPPPVHEAANPDCAT